VATAGTPEVRISTPGPGGGLSSPQVFVITAAPTSGGGSSSGGSSGGGGGGGGCGVGALSALVLLSAGLTVSRL
jgi:hypothetical protein